MLHCGLDRSKFTYCGIYTTVKHRQLFIRVFLSLHIFYCKLQIHIGLKRINLCSVFVYPLPQILKNTLKCVILSAHKQPCHYHNSHFNSNSIFAGTYELDLQGPVFTHEPPHKVEFSNSTGGHIECSGHGSPEPEVSKSTV